MAGFRSDSGYLTDSKVNKPLDNPQNTPIMVSMCRDTCPKLPMLSLQSNTRQANLVQSQKDERTIMFILLRFQRSHKLEYKGNDKTSIRSITNHFATLNELDSTLKCAQEYNASHCVSSCPRLALASNRKQTTMELAIND